MSVAKENGQKMNPKPANSGLDGTDASGLRGLRDMLDAAGIPSIWKGNS
jgi:hypothetical protein